MIDYSPLWKTMEEKNFSQYKLLKVIDNKTLDFIKNGGGNITLLTLEKICKALGCSPNDVIRFK